jgi:hypothetical protein
MMGVWNNAMIIRVIESFPNIPLFQYFSGPAYSHQNAWSSRESSA